MKSGETLGTGMSEQLDELASARLKLQGAHILVVEDNPFNQLVVADLLKIAGSKIIVVLGHTKCGAVKGACDHVEMGNLTALLSKLQPAVYDEKTETENRHSGNDEFVEKVSAINVKRAVHAIMERSPILKEMIEIGAIGIVGGSHEITTGAVKFYLITHKFQQL